MRNARRLAKTALPIAIAAFASGTAFHALAGASRPLQPESTPVEIVASRAAEAGRSPSTAVVGLVPAAMDTVPHPKARALPLAFEENVGQAGASVRYLARGAGSALYLSAHEAVLTLRHPEGTGQVLNMRLVGDRPAPRLTGEDPLGGISNYFIGNDPARWRTGVTHYGKVRYAAVYPGIDLVYYGREGQLEYDFVVAPGADPHAIRIEYSGATSLRIADNGDLVLDLAGGEVRHHAPVVYQELGGGRRAVAGRFVLEGPHRVGFEVGDYDRDRSLVIDPVLSYSSYLGGSAAEYLWAMAMHTDGSVVLVGETGSVDFPVAGNPQKTTLGGSYDAWVAKFNASGTELVYSTYLGGSEQDDAFAVALDAAGNAYVTGETASDDFPVAGTPFQGVRQGNFDVFVTKLSPTGSALVYSTYLGGTDSEGARAIAVTPGGEAVVGGDVVSNDFPIAGSAFQALHHGAYDGFVARLSATGSTLVYSTYVGGSGNDDVQDLRLGADGSVYVVGATASADFPVAGSPVQGAYGGAGDAYALRLSTAGSTLLFSTFLGGTANDVAYAVALDAGGNLVVGGETESTDFPTAGTPVQGDFRGGTDGFAAKLNPAGSSLVYSTYLGGSGYDWVSGMTVDAAGSVHLTGPTTSSDFPVAGTPVQGAYGGGSHDAFLSTLNPSGSALTFSSFLGGTGYDGGVAVAIDGNGGLVLGGMTKSADFPLVGTPVQGSWAGSIDAFIAIIATSTGDEPVAAFTWSPSVPDVGQAVQFTDTSTGGPTSWSWAFGDGETSTTQNPVHVYASAGARTVTLTVTNSHGSSARSQTVSVGCEPILGVPTLTATVIASGIIRLSWTAVPGATGYRLYRSEWPAASAPIVEGSGLTHTDTELKPQVLYCYSVETYNLCGNGSITPSQCVRTPAALPYAMWVPVASHAAGVAGSEWRTDLALLNTDTNEAAYELRFHRGQDLVVAGDSVPALSQAILTDVVDQLGDSGSGALEVRSDRPIKVSSRIYNQSAEGTFGQNVPGSLASEGLATGQLAYLPQLTESSAYRSNILLTNASAAPATAIVELHDAGGATLAQYTVTLNPGEWRQENRPFFTKAGRDNLAAGSATVRVTAGAGVLALASVVDNLTNDPTTQTMVVAPAGSASRWLPVASHAAGALGSQWRTDLGILNTGSQPSSYNLHFIAGGNETASSGTAAAGGQLILEDIVGLLGASGSGALRVEAGPGVIVSSRTYNQSSSGSLGQNLPGLEASQGLAAGQSAYLPQLTENTSYRSNILLTNIGSSAAAALVQLYDGAGARLANYTVQLAAGEWKQENRPFFTKAGQTDLASGYARVTVTSGSGVVACASVVDNLTNDPTTILAAE